MSKPLFYAIVISLFCMIPISFVGILGNMVSKKYEVDEAYNLPYGSESLTQEEQLENERIDQLDFELNRNIVGFWALGISSILAIVILVWKRIKMVMNAP